MSNEDLSLEIGVHVDSGPIERLQKIADRLEKSLSKLGFADTNTARSEKELNKEAEKLGKNLKEQKKQSDSAAKGLDKVSKSAKGAENSFASASKKIADYGKALASAYVVYKGVDFARQSMSAYNVQHAADIGMAQRFKNVGFGIEDYNWAKERASQIQGQTTFGDEAVQGAIGELSTFTENNRQALDLMLNHLADFAIDLTGQTQLDKQALTDVATQMGKAAFMGAYDGLSKKGYDTSELKALDEVQKIWEAMKSADSKERKKAEQAWTGVDKNTRELVKQNNGVTAIMRANAFSTAMSANKGLASAMANTPEGKMIQFQNRVGDMMEEVGSKLYASLIPVFDSLENNEVIDSFVNSLGNLGQSIINLGVSAIPILDTMIQAFDLVAQGWTDIFDGVISGIDHIKERLNEIAEGTTKEAGERRRNAGLLALNEALDYINAGNPKDQDVAMELLTTWSHNLGTGEDIKGEEYKKVRDFLQARGLGHWMNLDNKSTLSMYGSKGSSFFDKWESKREGHKPLSDDWVKEIFNAKGKVNFSDNRTTVNQTNNIGAEFNELSRLVKENLTQILQSQLRIVKYNDQLAEIT